MQPCYNGTMNAAKSVNERVSDLRARRKAQGLVKLEMWVHEKDVTRIKKEAVCLAARRARLLKQGLDIPSLEDEEARMVASLKRQGKIGKPAV
jgi:hypothetical protein